MLFSCCLSAYSSLFATDHLKYPVLWCWGTPSVKRPTLDLGSGHDLTVRELEPHVGLCADSTEPAWDSVSPSLYPSPTVRVLSLSQT